MKCLSDAQLARFLKCSKVRHARGGHRDHLLLAFLSATGVRPSEALNLKAADFHLQHREPWVRIRRLKKRSTRGVIDDMPLSRALAWALRPLVAELEAGARPWPFTLRRLQAIFHEVAAAADLPEGTPLYTLRHTAGTRLYRATRDPLLVKEQLGHSRLSTSQVYMHSDPEARRRAAELVGSDV